MPGGRERLFARALAESATIGSTGSTTAPGAAQGSPPPPPPGVDATVFRAPAAGTTAAALANLSLGEALARIRSQPAPASLAPIQSREPDDDSKREAEKRYAAAKMLLGSGKPEEALADLQQAAKLDPSAAGPWEQIAVVHALGGRRSAATAAWQQAVRRGSKDQDVLRSLAREALRNMRATDALWLLARSRRDDTRAESLADLAAEVDLAEALDRAGFEAAADNLYGQTLERPQIRSATARNADELSDVVRRRGELSLRAGDLAMRRNDAARARAWYDIAAEYPMLDAGALAVRRVYLYVCCGMPASAAATLIQKIESGGGNVEERELALIGYLAAHTDVGADLASALAESPALKDASPSVRGRATRAAAAALPRDQTRSMLHARLMAQPGDAETLSDFLQTFGDQDLAARDEALSQLATASPRHAATYAALLLGDGRGLGSAAQRFVERRDNLGSQVLAGYLLLALGKPADAARAVEQVRAWPKEARAAGLAAAADVAARAGLYPRALEYVEALRAEIGSQSPARDRLCLARALGSVQRHDEALLAMGDQLSSLEPDDRLMAAEIARIAGKLDIAETLLRSLSDADPADERPAEQLIALYAGGPLADDSRLAQIIQQIRSRVSSSRILRWAVANEQVQRQQWGPAEQTLRGLADEDPTSPGLIERLTYVWTRAGGEAASRGRDWLSARLAATPESADVLAALARLEALGGQPDAAIAKLDARLAQWPIAKLASLREQILGEIKGEKAAARDAGILRLTPGPRTIDDTLALAGLLLEAGRSGDILGVLGDPASGGLPVGVPLTKLQQSRLAALAGEASAKDSDIVDGGGEPVSPALIALLTHRGIDVPPALREYRVLLLARSKTPDELAIATAFRETVPEAGLRPVAADRITRKLLSSTSPRSAVVFRFAYIASLDDPSPESLAVLAATVGEAGTPDDLRRAMPILTNGTRGQAVMARLRGGDEDVPKPSDIPAELAYDIAGYAMSLDRVAEATGMYRVVLDIDPQHAMTCNDLGYQLVEDRDPDLALAERLLERAYTLSGRNSNVADSLAWLRYMQGRLVDKPGVPGPEGLGAITLIEDAIKLHDLDRDSRLLPNPTIYDHLGDILWAAGRKDEAKRAWERARAALPAQLAGGDDMGIDAGTTGDRLRHFRRLMGSTRDRVNSKLEALRTGQAPPVTPQRIPSR